MKIISRKFLIPLFLGILIILINFQWMIIYQLPYAPAGDSLVYITEAFNDYWIVRAGNYFELLNKYFLVGNQINSPLLSLMAVISFLFFGLNPINAYLVMAFLYLLWVIGIIYLGWLIKKDLNFALASGLLAVLLPSASVYQLRHFMLDFAAASPFIWATAFLIKSNLFNKRADAIYYALLVSITILFRSTSFMYFFSHVGIILLQVIFGRVRLNYKNILLVLSIVTIIVGIFIFPNINRIITYYVYWAQVASASSVQNTFFENLKFYLHQLTSFHMLRPGFAFYCIVTFLGACIFAIKLYKNDLKVNYKEFVLRPLCNVIPLIVIPTLILSSYNSRASSVDFIFIGAYIYIPIIFWRSIFFDSKYFWIPIAIIMFGFALTNFNHHIKGTQINVSEREILGRILSNAEERGLNEITLGNTAIHQHNSLSYQYWTLANYFPSWTNKVKLASIGRTNSADELAKMNSNSDYVITLDGYKADWVPNNIVAPEANNILQKNYHMKMLPFEYALPNGVNLKILARQVGVSFKAPFADGWHENNVPIKIINPIKKEVLLMVTGSLMNVSSEKNDTIITLQSSANPNDTLNFTATSNTLNHVFIIPAKFFNDKDAVELLLINSSSTRPATISSSSDMRNLAFRNLYLKIISKKIE